MKNTFLIFILLTIALKGLAQSENGDRYKKAKLYLTDHRIIRVNDLKIDQMTARYFDTKKNREAELSIQNIASIKIPKGNYLWEGALFGTATLSLSALLIDIDTDPLGQPREKTAGFYLAMAGSGAALGALIGLLVKKWKPLSLKEKSIGLYMPIDLDISAQTNALTLKITMKL